MMIFMAKKYKQDFKIRIVIKKRGKKVREINTTNPDYACKNIRYACNNNRSKY